MKNKIICGHNVEVLNQFPWSNKGDVVLDPFNGSGTTTKMAYLNYRDYIGIDCSEKYCNIAKERLKINRENYLSDNKEIIKKKIKQLSRY